jgi:RNA polymerase sigma-70 factor, ECF subfamily
MVLSARWNLNERELLDVARSGDEDAFARLIAPHRAGLHAHCYRMLGSLHDAEDALQDALLRAWRGLAGFNGRSSLHTWLHRITTNACLDALARRPKRVLPVDYGPPTDPAADAPEPLPGDVWLQPYPDGLLGVDDGYAAPEARYEQREAVELAFIAALQHLPPRQRAVLILREVLGFSAVEVAGALDATPAAIHSALRRARKTVDDRLPQLSQQATLRALGDEGVHGLVQRFVDAFEGGDVPAILAMLTEDATFAIPPYAEWCRGRDAIANSWLMPGGPPPRLRYVPTQANGQLALGAYLLQPGRRTYRPIALDVLTVRGTQIAAVTAFRTPELFRWFRLPGALPAATPPAARTSTGHRDPSLGPSSAGRGG